MGTIMQKQSSVWMTRVDEAAPQSFHRAAGAKALGINTAFGLPVPAAVIDPAADPPFAAVRPQADMFFYSASYNASRLSLCLADLLLHGSDRWAFV